MMTMMMVSQQLHLLSRSFACLHGQLLLLPPPLLLRLISRRRRRRLQDDQGVARGVKVAPITAGDERRRGDHLDHLRLPLSSCSRLPLRPALIGKILSWDLVRPSFPMTWIHAAGAGELWLCRGCNSASDPGQRL